MFWYYLVPALVARTARLNYCAVLHSRLPLSSPPAFWTSVLFLINILLWWVTLPFIYRQLLPDNVFFRPPLPLKGAQPILSRMLMPCKSWSEAELRGEQTTPSFFWWALLKNSIRVLNHRHKNIAFSVRGVCFFFFPPSIRTQSRFLSAWKGDICQVCTWQKIWATQKKGIDPQSSVGWI